MLNVFQHMGLNMLKPRRHHFLFVASIGYCRRIVIKGIWDAFDCRSVRRPVGTIIDFRWYWIYIYIYIAINNTRTFQCPLSWYWIFNYQIFHFALRLLLPLYYSSYLCCEIRSSKYNFNYPDIFHDFSSVISENFSANVLN